MNEFNEKTQRIWEKIKTPVMVIATIAFLIWFALFSPCH